MVTTNTEDRPYKKKGGPDKRPEPKVVTPLRMAEDYEQVPIDLTQLVAAKKQLTEAEKLAQDTAQAGITLVKAIAQAAKLGVEAEQAEVKVRTTLREILTTHNVTVNEFRGFDFDRGVIKIQREAEGDAGTSR